MNNNGGDMDGKSMDNQEFYVRYKIKDSEMEAKGDRDHVNQHAVAFLTLVADGKPIQLQLPNPVEKETPLLVQSNGVSPNVSGDNSLNHKPLPTLYREKSPKSQPDQILVITYFYQVVMEHAQVSYNDLNAAYTELLSIGADDPSNPRQSVKTLVGRKLLYKPNRSEGVFALTDDGVDYVEKMGKPQ